MFSRHTQDPGEVHKIRNPDFNKTQIKYMFWYFRQILLCVILSHLPHTGVTGAVTGKFIWFILIIIILLLSSPQWPWPIGWRSRKYRKEAGRSLGVQFYVALSETRPSLMWWSPPLQETGKQYKYSNILNCFLKIKQNLAELCEMILIFLFQLLFWSTKHSVCGCVYSTCTCVSRPSRIIIIKKHTAQSWGRGIKATDWG